MKFPSVRRSVLTKINSAAFETLEPYVDLYHYSAQTGIEFTNFRAALHHYTESGGLVDLHPLFSGAWVRQQSEVAAEFTSLEHYVAHWKSGISPHPLFDSKWYLETYPDVAAAQIDPLRHYITHGAVEGRKPSPFFDAAWYLTKYSDIRAAGENPVVHYLRHGAKEGRDPSAEFSTSWYLKKNPDVAAAGVNPLVHYVTAGLHEGRKPAPRRKFALDENYGLPKPDFEEWRAQLFEAALSPPRPYKSFRSKHEILLLIDVPEINTMAYPQSLLTFDVAATELGVSYKLETQRAVFDRKASGIDSSATCVFCGANDRFDASGLRMLLMRPTSETLTVFDTYFEAEGIVFPVLQPGPNPIYLSQIDGCFSRFAIQGVLLATALDACPTKPAASQVIQAAVRVLVETEQTAQLGHCAFPVCETPDQRDLIQRVRAGLVKRAPCLQAEASFTRAVTVVICTKDKGHLTDQLIRSLLRDSGDLISKVVVVANNTTNFYALETLARWSDDPSVCVIKYDKPFNFSEQSNLGAKLSAGEFLLLLNDDIIPITPRWLHNLVKHFRDPSIGAAGPLLIYPNESVQHAGMFIGFRGAAGHTLRHASLPKNDYLFYSMAAREVSCLTGAALLIRTSCYQDLRGLDEHLMSIFQDVDICLRISNLGLRLIYEPQAILFHMESVSLLGELGRPDLQEQRGREHAYFVARHGAEALKRDRFHNPSLGIDDETLRTLVC